MAHNFCDQVFGCFATGCVMLEHARVLCQQLSLRQCDSSLFRLRFFSVASQAFQVNLNAQYRNSLLGVSCYNLKLSRRGAVTDKYYWCGYMNYAFYADDASFKIMRLTSSAGFHLVDFKYMLADPGLYN